MPLERFRIDGYVGQLRHDVHDTRSGKSSHATRQPFSGVCPVTCIEICLRQTRRATNRQLDQLARTLTDFLISESETTGSSKQLLVRMAKHLESSFGRA